MEALESLKEWSSRMYVCELQQCFLIMLVCKMLGP